MDKVNPKLFISSSPCLPLFDFKTHRRRWRESFEQPPVLVKAKPRSHRMCVGSGLSSCGMRCLRPQVLVVGHMA